MQSSACFKVNITRVKERIQSQQGSTVQHIESQKCPKSVPEPPELNKRDWNCCCYMWKHVASHANIVVGIYDRILNHLYLLRVFTYIFYALMHKCHVPVHTVLIVSAIWLWLSVANHNLGSLKFMMTQWWTA